MSILTILSLIGGFLLLVIGADLLVRGASSLATLVGLSPLVIGLTVVSYGTSAPELAVSLQSYAHGQVDIALGNVIGSNIFNVLMILGLSAVIVPLTVAQQLIRLDVPIMIGVSALMVVFAMDGRIEQWEGMLLLMGSVLYTVFLVYQGRKESKLIAQNALCPPGDALVKRTPVQILVSVGLVLIGLGLLVVGGRFLVYGAVEIAEAMGVSQLIIGLTIVAAGTSMPELATSVVASYRGEQDIAVGNVVGSNIFNILTVLGTISMLGGIPVSTAALRLDLPVLLAVAIACFPIFYTGNRISRWEGLLFVGYYVAYSAYLIMNTVEHSQLGVYNYVMLLFVIPLTVITLLTLVWQHFPHPRRKSTRE
ncbi:calcium/sodium antiporter [Leptolyngbya sp. PCC 6406]|uniref:calcium/sodium antiporter n=1 Tax=Leptolyngbya sp. PCC 6406 TaxID=1173264 RepID=UPI0002ACCA18|nr:calcium/sodium antiporter [Leptolyngbya sp. PCC 6406]